MSLLHLENKKTNNSERENKNHDDLITDLAGIAKLFNCSLPKAQNIKNSIPKNMYKQYGRIFAIQKQVLLAGNNIKNRSCAIFYQY